MYFKANMCEWVAKLVSLSYHPTLRWVFSLHCKLRNNSGSEKKLFLKINGPQIKQISTADD